MDEVLYFFLAAPTQRWSRCKMSPDLQKDGCDFIELFFLLQVLQQLSEGMSSYNAVGFEVSHSVHFGRPTGIPGCLSLQCHVFQ